MICEAFQCPPDVAMQQDMALCEQIITMRNYAELEAAEQRDPKSLTTEQRRWVAMLEKAYS